MRFFQLVAVVLEEGLKFLDYLCSPCILPDFKEYIHIKHHSGLTEEETEEKLQSLLDSVAAIYNTCSHPPVSTAITSDLLAQFQDAFLEHCAPIMAHCGTPDSSYGKLWAEVGKPYSKAIKAIIAAFLEDNVFGENDIETVILKNMSTKLDWLWRAPTWASWDWANHIQPLFCPAYFTALIKLLHQESPALVEVSS